MPPNTPVDQSQDAYWTEGAKDPITGEPRPTFEQAAQFQNWLLTSPELNLTDFERQQIVNDFVRGGHFRMRTFQQEAEDRSGASTGQGLIDEGIAERDRARLAGQQRLLDLEGEILPGFASNITRFTGQPGPLAGALAPSSIDKATDLEFQEGGLVDREEQTGALLGGQLMPGFIFKDPAFNDARQAAENAINQNIANTRNNAALANVSAGVRSSGKSIDRVQQAERGAAQGKGGVRSTLSLGAIEALDRAKGAYTGATTGLTEAMNALDQGYLPSGLNWAALGQTAQGPNAYGPRATLIDEQFGKAGLDLAGGGLAAQILFGLLGAGQTGIGQAGSVLDRFLPGGN